MKRSIGMRGCALWTSSIMTALTASAVLAESGYFDRVSDFDGLRVVNAEAARGAPDGRSARIQPNGTLTLDIGRGRHFENVADDDIYVYIENEHKVKYKVHVLDSDTGEWKKVGKKRRSKGFEIGDDGIDTGRYVRIENVGNTPLEVDAVVAAAVSAERGERAADRPRGRRRDLAFFENSIDAVRVENADRAEGEPDNRYAVLRQGGRLTLDLGPHSRFRDARGNDVFVRVRNSADVNYSVYVQHPRNGEWVAIGTGRRSGGFDLGNAREDLRAVRYVRIVNNSRSPLRLDAVGVDAELDHPGRPRRPRIGWNHDRQREGRVRHAQQADGEPDGRYAIVETGGTLDINMLNEDVGYGRNDLLVHVADDSRTDYVVEVEDPRSRGWIAVGRAAGSGRFDLDRFGSAAKTHVRIRNIGNAPLRIDSVTTEPPILSPGDIFGELMDSFFQ